MSKTRRDHMTGFYTDRLQLYPANIRLNSKSLQGAIAPAHLASSWVTPKQSFTPPISGQLPPQTKPNKTAPSPSNSLSPGDNVLKNLSLPSTMIFWSNKSGPGLYSEQLIFFVTYKWAQSARVFVPDKLFQSNVVQHSTLMGPFVNYEEKDVLCVYPGLYLQHFIFFVTYKWAQ